MKKGLGELRNLNEQTSDDDDDDEDNNLIEIQLQLSVIKVNFINLFTYSKLIRDEYQTFTETKLKLPEKFQIFQKEFKVSDENSIIFFSAFKNENFLINNHNYGDLYKLSNFFQVKKLIKFLNQYKNNHNFDIDFIINEILKKINEEASDDYIIGKFKFELESNLYNRANECLQNENFGLLPISIVYRILSKSEEIPNDLLFDFISKSIEERCTLFNFLNIQNLSDIKLGELFDLYDQNPNCFQYFPSNFGFLKSIITENKKMKTQLIELNEKCDKFQRYLDDACKMANFYFGGEDFIGDIFLHLGQCSERGNMLASLCIGFLYMITDDDSKKMNALPYLQKSIEQGNSYALLLIGTLYEEGECVEQSYSKAIEIYQESASKGNLVALCK